MRTISIPFCSYEIYEAMRDVIIKNVPFSVINDMYSKKKQIAVFNLWDSDYIPDELTEFILQPPLSRENKAKMSSELASLSGQLDEIRELIKLSKE